MAFRLRNSGPVSGAGPAAQRAGPADQRAVAPGAAGAEVCTYEEYVPFGNLGLAALGLGFVGVIVGKLAEG